MWHIAHDYVRLLLTKTPENNLDSRKKSLGEILMDIMYGCELDVRVYVLLTEKTAVLDDVTIGD